MASPAQIAANQANAQKATGPVTDAGKAITRKNASRHGLCSTMPTLYAEGVEASKLLLADLVEEHQPQGPTEEILVFKMAEQFRLSKRASYFLAMYTECCQDSDHTKDIALFLRYYTTADRAFNRNLAELRKLQKERRAQEADAAIGSVSQNVETHPCPAEPQTENPTETAPLATPKTAPIALVEEIIASTGDANSFAPQKLAA